MIRIAICDDDKRYIEILKEKVSLFSDENKVAIKIKTYTNCLNLFSDISEGKNYDIILSDIEMPNMNGLELVKKIKDNLSDTIFIFITGHTKYSIDSFELSIFRYIPKNEIDDRLPKALTDAVKIVNLQKEEYYIIRATNRYEKIPFKKIEHIYREGKNIVLSIKKEGNKIVPRKTLDEIYNEIKSDDFIFINRSDIVNIVHILKVNNNMVQLDSKKKLPISRKNLEEVLDKLSSFWSDKV